MVRPKGWKLAPNVAITAWVPLIVSSPPILQGCTERFTFNGLIHDVQNRHGLIQDVKNRHRLMPFFPPLDPGA
jgi:hypothetical protein